MSQDKEQEPKKLFNMRDYYEPSLPISNHRPRNSQEEYIPSYKKSGKKRAGM